MVVKIDDELIRAYFRNRYNNNADDDFWAWETVEDILQFSPLEGWGLVLTLLASASSNGELAYLAAGPLESLLRWNGFLVKDLVYEEASRNKVLRYALAGVWLDEEGDSFYSELTKLIDIYKLDEINPLTNTPWSEENDRPG